MDIKNSLRLTYNVGNVTKMSASCEKTKEDVDNKKFRRKSSDKVVDLLPQKLKLPKPGWFLIAAIVFLVCSFYVLQYSQKTCVKEVANEQQQPPQVSIKGRQENGASQPKSPEVSVTPESSLKKFQKDVLHQDDHEHNCFCQLHGAINDDCSCQVDAVDQFNNYKVYPRLQSLLSKNYFRYYPVNLKKECLFWSDDGQCAFEFCQVKTCGENEVPAGLKGQKDHTVLSNKKLKDQELSIGCNNEEEDLGYINETLSAESQMNFERWKTHDEGLTDFCSVKEDGDETDMQYVDLLLNPERFTGYAGASAHRVWDSIYKENCFEEENRLIDPFDVTKNDTCIEKRTFYRAISGLHSSINIHLSYKYLLGRSTASSMFSEKHDLIWGPNVTEFKQHFQITEKDNRAHAWLKNLYFLYLLELKAIAKVSPFFEQFELYTGDSEEDTDMKLAVQDLLKVVKSFPYHFEEKALFSTKDSKKLRLEVHHRFTNITRIMDCVGCQKCKLWGKLQTKGLGTALKILFSPRADFKPKNSNQTFLDRSEIVSLFNAFGRLSESIHALGKFRYLIQQDEQENGTGIPSSTSPITSHSNNKQKKPQPKFPF